MTTPSAYSVITGALTTVGSTVSILTGYTGSVGIHLGSVSATGQTIVFEETIDGVTWTAVNVSTVGTSSSSVSKATGVGDFQVASCSWLQFRVRLTAITGGVVPVTLVGTSGSTSSGSSGGGGGSGSVTVTNTVNVIVLTPDSTGNFPLNPDALPHVYTYNGPNGAIDTDTCTNGTLTWKKTYTYTASNLTGESAWVKQ